MDDLIDRNQLLEWLKVAVFENYNGEECFRYTIQEIENAPAIDRLVPCSEQLPDKDGKYLVLLNNDSWDILDYDTELEQFGWTDDYKDEFGYNITEWYDSTKMVVSWTSLPEKL